jgi:hypothetical protein
MTVESSRDVSLKRNRYSRRLRLQPTLFETCFWIAGVEVVRDNVRRKTMRKTRYQYDDTMSGRWFMEEMDLSERAGFFD